MRRCTRERAKVSCTGGGEECASGGGDANKQRIGGVKSSTRATESSGGVVAWWPCWCCAGHSWTKHKCPPAADSWLVTGHRPVLVIVMPGLVASLLTRAHFVHRKHTSHTVSVNFCWNGCGVRAVAILAIAFYINGQYCFSLPCSRLPHVNHFEYAQRIRSTTFCCLSSPVLTSTSSLISTRNS